MAFTRPALEQYAARERDRFEEALKDFVEVPSISADPGRKADVERCAELGAATIRAFGGRAEIHRVPGGNPIVLGSFEVGKGRPTVTVYNHLDVQPASKETEPWRTEPFEFTREGDTYFGRGTTDDKGPALTALFGARAALEAGVPVNVKFLWESEEEIGSPHFAETLRAIGPAAATDAVVVSDTVWVSRGRPSLVGGSARPAADHLPPRDRGDRPALGHDRGRRPQPRGRARPAGRGDLRRAHRPREDPRLLRRRREAHREAGRGLQGGGLQREGLHDGPRLQVDPGEGPARGHEADLGDADLRGARPRGRVHGPGREDDRAPPRGAQGLRPPRPEHEGREGGEAREGVREEEEPRRARRGRLLRRALQGHHERAVGRGGEALRQVRLRQGRRSSSARAGRSAPCSRWSRS